MNTRRLILTGLAALALPGCVFLAPSTEVPMPAISRPAAQSDGGTLLIMLPGRGDRMGRFEEAGFPAPAADRTYDVLMTDAHWGYYLSRSLPARLHEDFVQPALAAGYDDIWMLGISMGGLGALLYASEHPDVVSRVILLAPYLGDEGLIREIDAAGGLNSWSGESDSAADFEVQIWRWLQQATADGDAQILLGYGEDDELANAYGPLIESLPSDRVFAAPGGHAWTVWTPLWQQIRTSEEFR